MITLKIGGRTLRLLYDMIANDAIEAHDWGVPVGGEDDDAPQTGFDAMVQAWNQPARMIDTGLDMLVIFANNASEVAGEPADLDKTWLKRHLRPGGMRLINEALRMTIRDAMRHTMDDPGDDDHDVVLEELEAKKDEAGA